jgi:hypothetical protein
MIINILNHLKKAAGIYDNPDQEGLDLFAKLIVEECISIAQAGLAPATVEVIKQRFGVEE